MGKGNQQTQYITGAPHSKHKHLRRGREGGRDVGGREGGIKGGRREGERGRERKEGEGGTEEGEKGGERGREKKEGRKERKNEASPVEAQHDYFSQCSIHQIKALGHLIRDGLINSFSWSGFPQYAVMDQIQKRARKWITLSG